MPKSQTSESSAESRSATRYIRRFLGIRNYVPPREEEEQRDVVPELPKSNKRSSLASIMTDAQKRQSMVLKHESVMLRTPNRYITNVNDNGQGVFDRSLPDQLPTEISPSGNLALHFAYATTSFPADFSNRADLKTYTNMLTDPPGIFLSEGTVLRIIDFPPAFETPSHQTVSIDYGVVLFGEMELILDSGESRILRQSDLTIQRGTDHMWRNRSPTKWARMMYVTHGAKPFEVNGKMLDGGYGMTR